MRSMLVVLFLGCSGSVTHEADAGDAGQAHDAGVNYLFSCSGYTYCIGPDGGRDPQPWRLSEDVCAGPTDGPADVSAAVRAAGRGPGCNGNFACRWDGGRC